jgi:alpha-tubulin suppressor-like RCC1 family protein
MLKSRPKSFARNVFPRISTLAVAITALAVVLNPASATAQVAAPQISAGAANTCAVFGPSPEKVYCWGSNVHKQLGIGENDLSYALNPIPVNALNGIPKFISTGYDSACAIVSYGSVRCWGNNQNGALGAANSGKNVPNKQVVAQLQGDWRAPGGVAVGQGHICVLDLDGSVKCQGLNSSGQLGNATVVNSATPVPVSDLGARSTQVVSGSNHSCALLDNGNVRCWGANNQGQLGLAVSGNPFSNVSVSVPDLPNDITQIASGYDHSCAIRKNDNVVCWGANNYGQLGDGTVTPSKGTETTESLGGRAIEVATGESHTCALLADGGVRCWGANGYGQLGNDTTTGSLKPVSVIGLPGAVTAITAGAFHTCAKLIDGSLRCWGRNDKGQLGNGTRDNSSKPVALGLFAGPSYAKVKLERAVGHSNFVGLFVVRPPVPGDIADRCIGSTISTVRVTQDGVTRRKGVRAKLRVSGTKCVATLRVNGISPSVSPADVYIRSSFRGNSRLPAAKFSQNFIGL